MNYRVADSEPPEHSLLDQRVKLFKGWSKLHTLDASRTPERGEPLFRRPEEKYELLAHAGLKG